MRRRGGELLDAQTSVVGGQAASDANDAAAQELNLLQPEEANHALAVSLSTLEFVKAGAALCSQPPAGRRRVAHPLPQRALGHDDDCLWRVGLVPAEHGIQEIQRQLAALETKIKSRAGCIEVRRAKIKACR